MIKSDLKECIKNALNHYDKKAKIPQICKFIWTNYESELRNSGNLFYTWQYDVRWAATELRREGTMKSKEEQTNGFWELA